MMLSLQPQQIILFICYTKERRGYAMEYKDGTFMDIFRIAVMWGATAVNTLFGSTDGLFLH